MGFRQLPASYLVGPFVGTYGIDGLFIVGNPAGARAEIGTNGAGESGIRLYAANGVTKTVNLNSVDGSVSIIGTLTAGPSNGPQVIVSQNATFGYVLIPTNRPLEYWDARVSAAASNPGASNEYVTLAISGPSMGAALPAARDTIEINLNSQNSDGSSNANINVSTRIQGVTPVSIVTIDKDFVTFNPPSEFKKEVIVQGNYAEGLNTGQVGSGTTTQEIALNTDTLLPVVGISGVPQISGHVYRLTLAIDYFRASTGALARFTWKAWKNSVGGSNQLGANVRYTMTGGANTQRRQALVTFIYKAASNSAITVLFSGQHNDSTSGSDWSVEWNSAGQFIVEDLGPSNVWIGL